MLDKLGNAAILDLDFDKRPEAAPRLSEIVKRVDGRGHQLLQLAAKAVGVEGPRGARGHLNRLYGCMTAVANDPTDSHEGLPGLGAWVKPCLEDTHGTPVEASPVPLSGGILRVEIMVER
jgi:hypothetical protein